MRFLSRINITKKIYHPSYVSLKDKNVAHRKTENSDVTQTCNNVNYETSQTSEMVVTDLVQRDFENSKATAKTLQIKFDKSYQCFLSRKYITPISTKCNEPRKAVSNLCLHLNVPSESIVKSNSLNSKRVTNMIASLQDLNLRNIKMQFSSTNVDDLNIAIPSNITYCISSDNLKINPNICEKPELDIVDFEKISDKIMEQPYILIEPETLNKTKKLKSSIGDEEREACLSSIPKSLCNDNEVSPLKSQCKSTKETLEPSSQCSVTPFIMPSQTNHRVSRLQNSTVRNILCKLFVLNWHDNI